MHQINHLRIQMTTLQHQVTPASDPSTAGLASESQITCLDRWGILVATADPSRAGPPKC